MMRDRNLKDPDVTRLHLRRQSTRKRLNFFLIFILKKCSEKFFRNRVFNKSQFQKKLGGLKGTLLGLGIWRGHLLTQTDPVESRPPAGLRKRPPVAKRDPFTAPAEIGCGATGLAAVSCTGGRHVGIEKCNLVMARAEAATGPDCHKSLQMGQWRQPWRQHG